MIGSSKAQAAASLLSCLGRGSGVLPPEVTPWH